MLAEVVITYESSSNSEVTERQISNISSKISNGKMFISAYCHLRDAVKSFSLNNILEIKVNGSIVDKYFFYYNNIRDKKKFKNELDDMLFQKQNEYDKFLEFYNEMNTMLKEGKMI
jgi:predicted DNA-binding transcriptional regulator YafY